MKESDIHHLFATEHRRLALWLLVCGSIWALGIALSVLIIEKLYIR
jgi:hypothetical protein